MKSRKNILVKSVIHGFILFSFCCLLGYFFLWERYRMKDLFIHKKVKIVHQNKLFDEEVFDGK